LVLHVEKDASLFEYSAQRVQHTRIQCVSDASELNATAASRLVAELIAQGVSASLLPPDQHAETTGISGIVTACSKHRASALGRVEHPDAERLIDHFHDAAARANEELYFGCFHSKGVFFGTDATERWTSEEFREWASPYFQRNSAWIFTVLKRMVHLNPEAKSAWFEEVLGSRSYGECRGTGSLVLTDSGWKIGHYNLSTPVPNALLDDVVKQIQKLEPEKGHKTIWLVRHGEKLSGQNPELSPVGRDRARQLARLLTVMPIRGIYTSDFNRTRQTARPLADRFGIQPLVYNAGEPDPLLAQLLQAPDAHYVVVGHSNTIPHLMKLLGVSEAVTLTEQDYDNIFQVEIGKSGASLTKLKY
jgi:phosphohistidine phosphatase SixA